MNITIDTEAQTGVQTSGFVVVYDKRWDNFTFSTKTIVSDLTQEVDGVPVSFIEGMEAADRGEVEPMFGEDGELKE